MILANVGEGGIKYNIIQCFVFDNPTLPPVISAHLLLLESYTSVSVQKKINLGVDISCTRANTGQIIIDICAYVTTSEFAPSFPWLSLQA